jgi:hypothetical protein
MRRQITAILSRRRRDRAGRGRGWRTLALGILAGAAALSAISTSADVAAQGTSRVAATDTAAQGTIASIAAANPAEANVAVTVHLRVEGASQTLYDSSVSTAPGALDGADGSGAHPCQGEQPEAPQATAAGTLSSAGIGWQGTWFPEFQDFFVNRIGPDASQPPFAYWALLVNWRYAQGACRAGLHDGDEVLWAYDTAQRPLILRLAGPAHVAAGLPFAVSVHDGWIRADGSDGGPVAGAPIDVTAIDGVAVGSSSAGLAVEGSVTDSVAVNNPVTGSDGEAALRLTQAGVFQLRATRAGAVASNALTVCVGDAACHTPEGAHSGPSTTPNNAASAPATSNFHQQGQPKKGAVHAKKTHRDARGCRSTRRTDRKRSGAGRHTSHGHRTRRGRNLDAAGAAHRHYDHHTHTRPGKLLGHQCRRRPAARHRR